MRSPRSGKEEGRFPPSTYRIAHDVCLCYLAQMAAVWTIVAVLVIVAAIAFTDSDDWLP
jgi:hypothetical protein